MSEDSRQFPARRADDRLAGVELDLRAVRDLLHMHLQQERDQAVQVATLSGTVSALAKSLDRIEQRDAEQQASLLALNEVLNQARGGWRAVLGIGIVVGGIAAAIAWLIDHLSLFGGGGGK